MLGCVVYAKQGLPPRHQDVRPGLQTASTPRARQEPDGLPLLRAPHVGVPTVQCSAVLSESNPPPWSRALIGVAQAEATTHATTHSVSTCTLRVPALLSISRGLGRLRSHLARGHPIFKVLVPLDERVVVRGGRGGLRLGHHFELLGGVARTAIEEVGVP